MELRYATRLGAIGISIHITLGFFYFLVNWGLLEHDFIPDIYKYFEILYLFGNILLLVFFVTLFKKQK